MLIAQNITYIHQNNDLLFQDISLVVGAHEKVALIGQNGSGKSTLLQIIAGILLPTNGSLTTMATPYYIPQIFGQFNHLTVAEALQVAVKITALHAILDGATSEENFAALEDDWTIEDRCKAALAYWQLSDIEGTQKMSTLSGGQKTKVFLAGIQIHQPQFVLLDEPSNHLDVAGRALLYEWIKETKTTLIIVSHDRVLLHLLDNICELTSQGIKQYGGNFEFYKEQKRIENNALNQEIANSEKTLRKAKEKERETMERQQKLDSRGKAKQEKSGVAKIMMNTLRNNAEKSTSKLKSVHTEKIDGIAQNLQELRASVVDIETMKLGLDHSQLHKGKILFTAQGINPIYEKKTLWKVALDLEIRSGDRIVIKGSNGSGKTTLINNILGNSTSFIGTTQQSSFRSVYIDQDYSLLRDSLTVYEQALQFNSAALQEHELKIRLNRFLFSKNTWDKTCSALSGGERMRLLLCCLTIGDKAPDMIVLDEPTNNLDIQNIEILTHAINDYKGTLLVVSHDVSFLEQINITKTISLYQ